MTTENDQRRNPFKVQSPEKLDASDAVDLFVNVFTDFYKVKDPGHSFLNGPRGSGKSMMFRYMQPDCQCLASKQPLHEIEFFAVYIPLKNTSLNVSELERIEGSHGAAHINEHLMVLFIGIEALKSILQGLHFADSDRLQKVGPGLDLATEVCRLLAHSGVRVDSATFAGATVETSLSNIRDYLSALYGAALQYIRRLSFASDSQAPDGPLLGYLDFLFPLLQKVRTLPALPNGPIYLLVDDADNLSSIQTRVLNTWVSSRTSTDVSIKISTQMEYKTFQTLGGRSIDATHDFSEVNISDIYTSSKGKYLQRVHEIVSKRLKKYEIRDASGRTPSPEEFFPIYLPQERRIYKIKEELRAKFAANEGRGFRASDDVVRYARPIYMAQLAGKRKSSSKYFYAGFEQLVHISSGIVRHFLESAAHMFSEVKAESSSGSILYIPPAVQDRIIGAESDSFRFADLEKVQEDETTKGGELENLDKLSNLVEALGGVFRACLLAEDRAERRVFSVALYDKPDEELRAVLKLGVRLGFFHRSSIGKKDGTGRTRLYILSRRLAPAFNLDPNGFVGYLWMSADNLKEAIRSPGALLNRVKKEGANTSFDVQQMVLFD